MGFFFSHPLHPFSPLPIFNFLFFFFNVLSRKKKKFSFAFIKLVFPVLFRISFGLFSLVFVKSFSSPLSVRFDERVKKRGVKC